MAKAVVEATAHFDDPELVGNVSKGLGKAMSGLEESLLETKMASRGQ
jgi:pyridoxal 5'-phosphate synthase pdxS subunit